MSEPLSSTTFGSLSIAPIPASQVWIAGEGSATIRPVESHQPLFTLRTGAPHVHISNVRLLGGLRVEGGDLDLTDCIIEPENSASQQKGAAGRRLNPSAGERPLSIDGGHVVLTRVVLRGHASGAISARSARLTLLESTVQGSRALFGGAIRVIQGSLTRLERCILIDNVADESGGALQVRKNSRFAHTLEPRLLTVHDAIGT